MSTYYQTTAKPRGRRQTGPYDSSTSSRAPSESSKLSKNTSRSSDESIPAQSTKSRTNSPTKSTQKKRTLDRSSMLETILPKSPSLQVSKSTEASATSVLDTSSKIHSSKAHASTPVSPIMNAFNPGSGPDHQPLHSKASSKSMTDAVNLETEQSVVVSTAIQSCRPNTKTPSSSDTQDLRTSQHSIEIAESHPSVADTSEDNTPMPTPSVEHEQMPFIPARAPECDQYARSTTHEDLWPRQHGDIPPQPLQQSTQTWYAETVPQRWPQAASPPQSPVIHQYGGFQTPGQAQYPYDFSHAYPLHVAPGGYQQYASSYYPALFLPPTEAALPSTVERHTAGSASGEEQSELVNRIQSVLPDLARLLEQSRDGQALPMVPDGTYAQPQLEQNEQLVSLQQELDATKKEYERVIRNLVDENCTLKSEAQDRQQRSRSLEGDPGASRKLRNEFEALQAQHQDLANSVDSIRLSKEELISEKLGVEKHIDLLRKDRYIIKDSHHRAVNDLKHQHTQELAARAREHQKVVAEHKSVLSKVQLDLATLISKHASTKKDLEIARSSETTYKASAEARLKELDAAKRYHIQYLDKLKAEHQRTLESIKQEHKTQYQRRENEAKKYVTELEALRSAQREWISRSQSLQAELQESKVALASETDAHTTLKTMFEERKIRTADLAGTMTLWRQKHAELEKESELLGHALHALAFQNSAKDIGLELQQTEPNIESLHMFDDRQSASAERIQVTGSADEVKQEGETRSVITVVTRKPEPVAEKEQLQTFGMQSSTGPVKAITPPEMANTTVSPEDANAPLTGMASLSADSSDVPRDDLATQATEKAARGSDKTEQAQVQAAEDLVLFRPIHYYQIPGQYR